MAGAGVEGPRGGGRLREADNGATAAALGHIHEASLDLVRKKLEKEGRGSREEEPEEGGAEVEARPARREERHSLPHEENRRRRHS
jgi:hypothetical protein